MHRDGIRRWIGSDAHNQLTLPERACHVQRPERMPLQLYPTWPQDKTSIAEDTSVLVDHAQPAAGVWIVKLDLGLWRVVARDGKHRATHPLEGGHGLDVFIKLVRLTVPGRWEDGLVKVARGDQDACPFSPTTPAPAQDDERRHRRRRGRHEQSRESHREPGQPRSWVSL